jgi:glycosyltransferase involved in cell wall biosynthesis
MRIQYNLKNNFVLLFVGSLIMKKGLQNIIEILPKIIKKNKNLRLFVVGSGNYRSNLELLVKKNNLEQNVLFIGKVNPKKMVTYYNLADLLVMPSLFIETFPYTILEAMSCGLPVFASNIGGIPEIINNKTGFLVDVNNKKQLINELSNAINSNNYKIKMYCINKIKKQYLITNMIKEYNLIYKKVQL